MIKSDIPLIGISFVLGKDLAVESYPFEENTVKLVSYEAQDSLKQELAYMVGWTLNYYNDTFGKKHTKRNVTIVLRPTADGDANYAVGDNYFATYDSKEDFFKNKRFHFGNFSHEIAHFWWQKADASTSENWLNESFAEFSSLLAVKHFFGDEVFLKVIEGHQKQVESIPDSVTLTNYERFGLYDQVMSYSVGTLVLYRIYEHIGEQEFYRLLSEIDDKQINTTKQFVALIDKKFKGKWKEELYKRIGK